MGRISLKICGLQSSGMLESIINLPIDYIGFMFAKSRRQVTPAQAKEMIASLRTKRTSKVLPFLTVGVFVNPDKDELIQVMQEASLDVVQLHGQETPDFCGWVKDKLHVKVFKVFSIADKDQNRGIEQLLESYSGFIDAVMLDTYDPTVVGGTGKSFSWEVIPLYHEWTKRFNLPLIIAGGLDAENVGQLIELYRPDGVDVSSGVETNGVKDIQKITAFVERVREIQ